MPKSQNTFQKIQTQCSLYIGKIKKVAKENKFLCGLAQKYAEIKKKIPFLKQNEQICWFIVIGVLLVVIGIGVDAGMAALGVSFLFSAQMLYYVKCMKKPQMMYCPHCKKETECYQKYNYLLYKLIAYSAIFGNFFSVLIFYFLRFVQNVNWSCSKCDTAIAPPVAKKVAKSATVKSGAVANEYALDQKVYCCLALFLSPFGSHNFYSKHIRDGVIKVFAPGVAAFIAYLIVGVKSRNVLEFIVQGWVAETLAILFAYIAIEVWALYEINNVKADAKGVPFKPDPKAVSICTICEAVVLGLYVMLLVWLFSRLR